jgi:heavy metal sensor kinase
VTLTSGVYHALWTAEGAVIDESDPGLRVPRPSAAGARTRDGRREIAVRTGSGAWVLAGRSLAPMRADLLALAGTVAVVGAAALALSLAGGWWWVGRALEPIDRISRTARAMTQGDLGARIPVDRVETELGQVASALNEAFDRLHDSVERQRRFAADASHELRTPVATISTETQWALARERQLAEYQRSIEICQRAADRMRGVIEQLLALARAESGGPADRAVEVRLDEVVRDVVQDVARLAEHRAIRIRTALGGPAVIGDPDRLREAITNVVVNAVQYNVAGGTVDIALTPADGWTSLVVRDTGVGIAAEDCARIFDPFVRVDPARGREAGGAGLGLAVTRAILRRHGGDVTCESAPGAGTTMTLRLATAGAAPAGTGSRTTAAPR